MPEDTMTDAPAPGRVADLPCPKCGNSDVVMRYITATRWQECVHVVCNHHGVEHFHRHCRRCGYQWTTLDVLPTAGGCTSSTRPWNPWGDKFTGSVHNECVLPPHPDDIAHESPSGLQWRWADPTGASVVLDSGSPLIDQTAPTLNVTLSEAGSL